MVPPLLAIAQTFMATPITKHKLGPTNNNFLGMCKRSSDWLEWLLQTGKSLLALYPVFQILKDTWIGIVVFIKFFELWHGVAKFTVKESVFMQP